MTENAGVKNTMAYKVVRQVLDHVWGPDEELSDEEFVRVFRAISRTGLSWEKVVLGDMASIQAIERVLELFVTTRGLNKIASRLSGMGTCPELHLLSARLNSVRAPFDECFKSFLE